MGALDAFTSGQRAEQALSPLKDPFGKERISRINISIDNDRWFNLPPTCHCTVYFKNGNTKGEQSFENPDLKAMMVEVQAFIDGLD